MKKVSLGLFLVLALVFASVSQAQFLGQVSTARTVSPGGSLVGGYIGVQDELLALFGQYRYGFAKYFDGGVKFGFIDLSDETGLVLGGDVKYQILEDPFTAPFDLALSGSVEFAATDPVTVLSFGGNVIGSKDFKLRTGRTISPYGKINLRAERVEVDQPPPFANVSDTDFEMGGYFGADFEVANSFHLLGEFVFDNEFGFIFGVNYSF
ncbi:MAG: hypothetical protein RBG1_1C00001G1042 [candidate division Zixibacteria bacterium RBG-1]|nr:MAG: hypothetical protein RBG1_1C00001G1042 [candidate division Zixibacteria bacterium RBG-1]OGC85710.1 MAG: hypothetical protein A2V73_01360 [candidate division Zixibacteria bacterium RBG_19FT_COMBO_42_43]